MKEDYQTWLWEKQGEKCVKNLKKHRFDAHFVNDVDEAASLCLELVSEYDTFGFGGSDTVRAMEIPGKLEKMGKTIYDHWDPSFDAGRVHETRLQQGRADCFFCSANGVSMTGEIINVDGAGNRVAAVAFGPKKVVILAGMNKVRPDLHSALARVREVAGPMRAKSLNMETPCVETGVCADCNSPQRICRITTILHRPTMLTDVSVVLVNAALGF